VRIHQLINVAQIEISRSHLIALHISVDNDTGEITTS